MRNCVLCLFCSLEIRDSGIFRVGRWVPYCYLYCVTCLSLYGCFECPGIASRIVLPALSNSFYWYQFSYYFFTSISVIFHCSHFSILANHSCFLRPLWWMWIAFVVQFHPIYPLQIKLFRRLVVAHWVDFLDLTRSNSLLHELPFPDYFTPYLLCKCFPLDSSYLHCSFFLSPY